MHVNVETQMSYIVTSERTMSPTGLYCIYYAEIQNDLWITHTGSDVCADNLQV